MAEIRIDSKQHYLGLFVSEEVAARKYDEAAALIGMPLNFASEIQQAPKGCSKRKHPSHFDFESTESTTARSSSTCGYTLNRSAQINSLTQEGKDSEDDADNCTE